jgi:catechol 2,3-dioxygenase-like lactoylglutathione lyase family enzyme
VNPTTHHTGLTVSDLDRSIEFYTELLGCTVESRFSVGGEALQTAVDTPGVSGTFAHLRSGQTRVELVEYEPAEKASPPESIPRPGATHLAFAVEDVDAFLKELPDDIESLSAPQTTESGTRIVFVRDPDGNFVELLEA